MSLITDSDVVSLDDLQAIDGEIQGVAGSESITVEGTGGIIRQSWSECLNEIMRAQQLYNTWYGSGAMSAPGQISVLQASSPASNMPRIRPANIVVTTQDERHESPVNVWMAYAALRNFYRAAANRLLKDRYELKMVRYEAEAKRAWGMLFSTGLPIVVKPLEAPGAIHGFHSGTWSTASLSSVSGGATAATSYDVAITWIDSVQYQTPAHKGNAESGPSAIVSFEVTVNKLMKIDITNLNPPVGAMDPVGVSQGITLPMNATGWNVYVGPVGGDLTLQNSVPVPIATKTYTLAAAPTTTGAYLGTGQFPDRNLMFSRTLHRG